MSSASPACLICGGTVLAERYHGLRDLIGRSSATYAFLACSRCGSLTADPLPTPEEAASFYPEQYTFREQAAGSPADRMVGKLLWWGYPRWTYTSDVALTIRVSGQRRGRLLDIGCGTGTHLGLFRRAGFDAEGIELSAEDCAVARQVTGCTVHHGTLERARLASAQFDVVTMFNVLEHLLNPRETAGSIRDLLRPGGWLVAKVPVSDGWQPSVFGRRWRNVREVPRHLSLPSTSGMTALFRACGMTQVRRRAASLLENACMAGTTLYPWAIPYVNEARFTQPAIKLLNTGIGALLTYLSIPEAILESLAGHPSTVIVAGQRPSA